MPQDQRDTADEVVNDLDDLKTAVEELQEDAPADARPAFDKLRSALEDASDAADEIEDRND